MQLLYKDSDVVRIEDSLRNSNYKDVNTSVFNKVLCLPLDNKMAEEYQ